MALAAADQQEDMLVRDSLQDLEIPKVQGLRERKVPDLQELRAPGLPEPKVPDLKELKVHALQGNLILLLLTPLLHQEAAATADHVVAEATAAALQAAQVAVADQQEVVAGNLSEIHR